MSRARIRVPASATPELVEAIHATNQAQGFTADGDGECAEEPGSPLPIALVVSEDFPQLEVPGTGGTPDLATRVAELERALARTEVRHAQRFDHAQTLWERERRTLEHQSDLIGVHYNRQLDEERALHARQREAFRRERDAALQRVEEMTREREGLAERVAELGAERDALLAQQAATAAELDRRGARVAELKQALGDARTRHAEELSARREEERRAMAHAAERLARERENSSEQLRDVLTQLEDALAQLEIARRELATERATGRHEVEVQVEAACEPVRSLHVGQEPSPSDEWPRSRLEAERLAGEIERLQHEKEAESTRCGALAERAQQLETELAQARQAYESEAQARRLAVEELQILLKYRPRIDAKSDSLGFEGQTPFEPEDDLEHLDPLADHDSLEPTDAGAGLLATTEVEANAGPTPALPLTAAAATNLSDSPDERIAALRDYLRRVQKQEEERMNNRFLRRLARAWRPIEPK